MVSDYIYIVHCEQHLHTNIYKIGRTSQQEFRRFNGYPKNSILLLYIHVNDSREVEPKLLELFRSKYTEIKSAGHEYFQGDITEMVKDMTSIALEYFDYTSENRISEEVIEIFPNYKYDHSFGGRYRLCLLRKNEEECNVYFIENKDLVCIPVDRTLANAILCTNCKKNVIKNNVYFKYNEKIITYVTSCMKKVSNILTDDEIEYYNPSDFINNPRLLFTCNISVNDYQFAYFSPTFAEKFITGLGKSLVDIRLIRKVFPHYVMFDTVDYGVLYEEEDITKVDCESITFNVLEGTNINRSEISLYAILYNNILKYRECLVSYYDLISQKYLQKVVDNLVGHVDVSSVINCYDPFSFATDIWTVLDNFRKMKKIVTLINPVDMYKSINYNYGLDFFSMQRIIKDNTPIEKLIVMGLPPGVEEWIENESSFNHSFDKEMAYKWWKKNDWKTIQAVKYISGRRNPVRITWHNMEFSYVL